MPTLQIDGIGEVEVGAEFLSLPPDRQAAEVDAIAAMVRGQAAPAPAPAPAETPASAPSAVPDLPGHLAGTIKGGVQDIREGFDQATNIEPGLSAMVDRLVGPAKQIAGAFNVATAPFATLSFAFGKAIEAASGGAIPVDEAEKALMAIRPRIGGRSPLKPSEPAPASVPALPDAPARPKITPDATTEDLRADAKSFYQKAEEAGVVLSPKSTRPLVNDIIRTAAGEGFDKSLHPRAAAALKRLHDDADQPLSFERLEILRRVVKSAGKSNDPDERRIVGIALDKIDDYIADLSAKDVVAGDPKTAAATIVKARDLWSRVAKLDTVADLVERASISAPNFSGSGFENALRTEFRSLAKNKSKMRTFNEKERKAIKRVAKGTVGSNTARNIGRFAPTGAVSAGLGIPTLAAAGAAVGGPVGAAVVTGAGVGATFAARTLATVLTRRNIAKLEQVIKAGGDSEMAREALIRSREMLTALTAAGAAQD